MNKNFDSSVGNQCEALESYLNYIMQEKPALESSNDIPMLISLLKCTGEQFETILIHLCWQLPVMPTVEKDVLQI